MLRIAVDGRTIMQGRSGIGMYAERTMKSLLRLDRTNEYFLFLVQPNDSLEAPNLTKVLIEGYHRVGLNRWWENILFPDFARRNKIDVLFSPANSLPMLPRLRGFTKFGGNSMLAQALFNTKNRIRYIATIHDVITDILPETFTPKLRFWQSVFNVNAVKVADRIITVSDCTQRDFIRIYGEPRGTISTIHSGVDESFSPVSNRKALTHLRARYSLPPKFILSVGTIEPRKNVAGLARAYSLLPERLRSEYPLVLCGGKGWYAEKIFSEIESLHLKDTVRHLGYVADEDLPALYTLASLFVFPSLYEGFGYPALEAMACGTPVIVSNRASLPEVVGNAGIQVDPMDHQGLAGRIRWVLSNKNIQEDMRRKGLRRAAMFTWRKSAQRTLRLLTSWD